MGQKINPFGYRLGITENHRSKWFSDSNKAGERYPRLRASGDDQIPQGDEQGPRARWRVPHRHRAHPRPRSRRHSHRPSGHRDRSSWRRG